MSLLNAPLGSDMALPGVLGEQEFSEVADLLGGGPDGEHKVAVEVICVSVDGPGCVVGI